MLNNSVFEISRRYFHGVEDAADETMQSMYTLMVQYCIAEVPEICDLPRLSAIGDANKPIFRLRKSETQKLRSFVGGNGKRGLGGELPRGAEAKWLMVPDLRYCPICLEQGLHAAVFQHVAILNCPLHGKQLEMGCPHCKHPIDTSCRAIVLNHHYCPSCGRAIGPFGSLQPEPPGWRDGILSLHESIRVSGCRPFYNDDRDRALANPSPAPAISLHYLWPKQRLQFERSFPLEAYLGPTKELDTWIVRLRGAWLGTICALLQIQAFLKKNQCYQDSPWQYIFETRCIGVRSPLPSAAYWRTVDALGAKKYLSVTRPTLDDELPFGNCLPDIPWSAQIVAEQHVFHLFAFCLLDLRTNFSEGHLPPTYSPAPVSVLPAWRLNQNGFGTKLEIRSRVSTPQVERLVQRYCRQDC